ncbi:RNA-binding protein [Nannocystis sp. SCPEA4]|uniref:RNA recognition motif domain-containing protein n=1 Tax=Nannocystis sp. SCPEA4 TaxID=2996787 RepID=UPI0022712C11|nr:RNA-binding protein [Nannocystis sp. SCPEA4]MCY1057347.1 RNA-binding protein [Nannocystis sp. SCPEA4]
MLRSSFERRLFDREPPPPPAHRAESPIQRRNKTMGNRLFVGNLSFQITDTDLQQAFQAYGTVQEVKVMTDRETGRSRGFAFVAMAKDSDAQQAIEGLNGASLDGRPLRVSVAEDRRNSFSGPSGGNNGYGGGGRKPSRGGDRY